MSALSADESRFVRELLARAPRLVTCDFDGTLWPHDAGSRFTAWDIARGGVAPAIARHVEAQYARYLAGEVDEDTMCALQVSMHRGRRDEELQARADAYIAEDVAPQWFPAMRALVDGLRAQRCEIWLVSSSSQWVIAAGARALGLDPARVLAAAAELEAGVVTERLTRLPSGAGKAEAIQSVIGRQPDMAFGNSRWDVEMLRLARAPVAINPSPELAVVAGAAGWPTFTPARAAG